MTAGANNGKTFRVRATPRHGVALSIYLLSIINYLDEGEGTVRFATPGKTPYKAGLRFGQ
jgi:hypothetical protein